MLRKQTFWGGVHPAGRKELSSGAPLEDCPPPREVVIPLLQHIGKPCTPLVKAGDHVDMGQKIGDGEGLCVPVHASVSGTVKAVEPRSHPSGQPHLAVVIENDFQNTYHSAVPPCADTDALDADALIRRIREAGLVGMGGATFPTDIKANIGKVETLIANACECEPYITADDALLCTDADRAIRGLRLLRQLLKPRRTVIAIEDNKERAVSILTDKLKQQDEVELVVLPTLLAGTIFFGLRCLLLAAVSIAAAGLAEALWNKLTRQYQTVEDLSAAVTGLLLALTLPATVPYWMAAVGAVFAVIVVKAAFGGLGQNIFNPALAARALLLLLFPASMTRFAAPGASVPLDLGSADVVTAATPLHSMVMPALPDVPLSEMFLGSIGGCIGEVSALALLIGGGYLVVRGVIKLRIPVSYLGTMAVLSFAFAPMEPLRWMLYSLLGGGVLLGALFMASDYATSPATPGGQVLYGIGCGVLTVLFRSVGLYPEGVTYAILLMNAASWLLERFTPTRLFGAPQRKGGLR